MPMNLIVENAVGMPFHTDMRKVLAALGLPAAALDWHLSDLETNQSPQILSWEDQWISGSELQRMLATTDIQFIWGVFSAVPVGHRPPVKSAPYANGNASYWRDTELTPQLKGALFEIVCWDSSATLLIGLPADAGERFCTAFPETKPLRGGESAP